MNQATAGPRVKSLNVGVYEKLKSMIVSRQLSVGDRLVQQKLAKELGTSVMPVIEALRRLERDGLVIHVPHLGSFVKEATVEDICELYCVRRGLESEACRLFVERASLSERAALRELNDRLNDLARGEDIAAYVEFDMKFHQHIIDASGCKRLQDIFEKWRIEQQVFQSSPEFQTGETLEHLIGSHDQIVAAVEAEDADAAAAAMRAHLIDAERHYLENVRKLQGKVQAR